MTQLDRSKSYGTVHGGGAVRFLQDDKFFDNQGFEVDASGKRLEAPPEKRPEPPVSVPQPVPVAPIAVAPSVETPPESVDIPSFSEPTKRLRIGRR